MEGLELIRTAHAIDHSLGRLVEATTEAALQDQIAAVQAEWKEITYRISAQVCGLEAVVPIRPRRRGRKPRLEQSAGAGRGADVVGVGRSEEESS